MFEKVLKKCVMLGVLAALFVPAGCGPFWVDPYITVDESQLNWVEIHYYNLNVKPIRRTSVFINGVGLVEVKKGASDRVSNDFAKLHNDANWDDYKAFRVHTDPKHVKDIFQNLVNYGLLDKDKYGRKSDAEKFDRFLAVKANIANNTYSETENIFEADPDLAEQLLDVLREFDNPLVR